MYVPTEGDQAVIIGNASTTPLPAIIVNTWEHTSYENDEVNLKVFTDGSNDIWPTSIPHDQETKAPGTWHWPEIK